VLLWKSASVSSFSGEPRTTKSTPNLWAYSEDQFAFALPGIGQCALPGTVVGLIERGEESAVFLGMKPSSQLSFWHSETCEQVINCRNSQNLVRRTFRARWKQARSRCAARTRLPQPAATVKSQLRLSETVSKGAFVIEQNFVRATVAQRKHRRLPSSRRPRARHAGARDRLTACKMISANDRRFSMTEVNRIPQRTCLFFIFF